jgi:septum formation protein
VTSDTIVWLDGKALGKPKDRIDAIAMLQKLSNQTHEVITSVCLKSIAKIEVFHCITQVTFAELSNEAIHYYLDQYQPFDKAGSYGIQDWIGLIGISKIEGSYTNVVGLPTEMLFKKIMNYV